ncbi:MAG: asparagine synthase-related protein, partial [Chloroflexota bacterium]
FGGYVTFDEVRRLRKMVAPADVVPSSIRRFLVPQLARLAPARRRARIIELFGRGTSYLDLALMARRIISDDANRTMGFDHRAVGLTEHWLPTEAYEPFTQINADLFHTVSQAETLLYMSNTLLRDTDVSSMNCSLETRVPFLGRTVVDLAGSIPGRVHFPPGPAKKHLLRLVASRLLPREVLERPKRGFLLPFTPWMNGPLREECTADMERFAGNSIVDGAAVRAGWQECIGRPGHTAQSRRLALIVLGSYLGSVHAAKPRPPL